MSASLRGVLPPEEQRVRQEPRPDLRGVDEYRCAARRAGVPYEITDVLRRDHQRPQAAVEEYEPLLRDLPPEQGHCALQSEPLPEELRLPDGVTLDQKKAAWKPAPERSELAPEYCSSSAQTGTVQKKHFQLRGGT